MKKINRKAHREQKKRRFEQKDLYYEASSSDEDESHYDQWGQKIIDPDEAYKRDALGSVDSNDSDELEKSRKRWNFLEK
jgi:hypothetical protein